MLMNVLHFTMPSETFGDFDHGLNKAVNRLREALQDPTVHPRFIKTLPKRGYRFLGVPVPTTGYPSGKADKANGHWKLKVTLLLGIVTLVLAAIVSNWYFRPHEPSRIESIAVMPLVNDTGDANNDYLGDGMTVSLIDDLSTIPDLVVRPRSSVFRYKDKDLDLHWKSNPGD